MLENRLHRRHPLVQFVMDNWIYIILFFVMWRLPYWLSDHFEKPVSDLSIRDMRRNEATNWLATIIELYWLAILAMSYNFIFGFSGLLSLGHAVFFGISVYAMVILIGDQDRSVFSAMITAIGAAALLGLFTSLAAFRIKGVYFAMFTLALAQIFYELSRVNILRGLTNGDDGLRWKTDVLPEVSMNINRLQLYYISAVAAGFTFLFIRRLMNSPTGKVLLAIRENEERAETMGFNVVRYKSFSIVLGGMLAALAGVIYALSTKGAEPTVLGVQRTVDPLLMTIIGGGGTNPGPVVGSSLLHLGEEFFRKADLSIDLNFILFRYTTEIDSTRDWPLALGIVFILIVLFIPYGIVGQINLLWVQMRRWCRKFIYDPLVRRFNAIATYMQPFTGEPSQVALYFAHESRDASLIEWAIKYPPAAVYSSALTIAALAGITTWDVHNFFDLTLFFVLITAPLLFGIWAWRNYYKLARLKDMFKNLPF